MKIQIFYRDITIYIIIFYSYRSLEYLLNYLKYKQALKVQQPRSFIISWSLSCMVMSSLVLSILVLSIFF